jgi:hypothetical protein
MTDAAVGKNQNRGVAKLKHNYFNEKRAYQNKGIYGYLRKTQNF